jgi:hypothetical protein
MPNPAALNFSENTLLLFARDCTREPYDTFFHRSAHGLRMLRHMAQAATHALQQHLVGYIFLTVKQGPCLGEHPFGSVQDVLAFVLDQTFALCD